MKKMISIIGILLFLGIVMAHPPDAYARWSPDANFRKAERSALRNGFSVGGQTTTFNSTSYVASLYLQGKIIVGQQDPTILGNAINNVIIPNLSATINSNKYALGLLDTKQGYCTGGTCYTSVADLVSHLITSLKAGKGLTIMDILALFPGAKPGQLGGTCGTSPYAQICSSGFYAVLQPDGTYLYYPLGTGPNPKAARGAVVTPTPAPGVIRARGVTTATISQTCDEIKAATTYRNGSQFDMRLGAVSKGVKTQSGSNYVSWSLPANTYRLVPLSTGASSVRVCLTDATGSYFGQYTAALAGGATDTFDVSYGPPPPWFQGQGGDVYAENTITSLTSANASPRQFVLSGAGGYPGIVTHGGAATDYDFAMEDANNGSAYVSGKNWLVNDKAGSRDFYNYFYSKFGNPTTADSLTIGALTKPAYDATKSFYYIQGDTTTSGDWNVADGEKYVFLIDGALTVSGKINITGNGFIAFIVKGDITVSPSVGVAAGSSAPVVEGVYITSGTLHTGTSTVAGAERFVGKGIFVGSDVRLERDLTAVNPSGASSSELFIYNPGLLVLMPDIMKTVPVSWQEVAP